MKTVELGTILGVWAHPDDETYLSAGLMAAAVDAGSRVVCITATRGEGGSMDEEQWPPESMGQVREQELIKSLAAIGVTEHHWLDLPDIDMDTSLPEAGAPMVREIMEQVQPDTVLTFGPDGMTGHRAHMSVSRWATDAFADVAPSDASAPASAEYGGATVVPSLLVHATEKAPGTSAHASTAPGRRKGERRGDRTRVSTGETYTLGGRRAVSQAPSEAI